MLSKSRTIPGKRAVMHGKSGKGSIANPVILQ